LTQKPMDKHQAWISWLTIIFSTLSFAVSAVSLYLSYKVDRARSENLSVTVEPIWRGYKASVYDRSSQNWYSITTQWRVVVVNTSDRPISISSYHTSNNNISLENGLYDKGGKVAILPLDLGPGNSATFYLYAKLWIDQRVFELFNKSETLPVEELNERLLQTYGIDFFGNDMTQRVLYLSHGKAIPYPLNGFKDGKIEIQFATARRNTFTGTGSWYDYEAINKQDIGENRAEMVVKLIKLRNKMIETKDWQGRACQPKDVSKTPGVFSFPTLKHSVPN
jgi:hypothetical protein